MVSYKYKLYNNKRVKHLNNMLWEACFVWNHALALQRRYYKLFKKYISKVDMQKHFAKRIHRTYLHSQSVQEVLQRLDTAYVRFFKHKAKRPPKFKKHTDFSSFVYKQSGYKLTDGVFHINSVNKDYRYHNSRKYEGNVKQIRFKKSPNGCWFIYVITDAVKSPIEKTHDGASVGIDFGMKTYLTMSDGNTVSNPQFLRLDLETLRRLSKKLSSKHHDSNHRKCARKALSSFHEHVANKRKDFQWKLAHELCKRYDYIFLEDLSMYSMATHKNWGRKIHDLAHSQFVNILKQVASRYGCVVHEISRWYASSKMCSCGYKNEQLSLHEREWVCPHCGAHHDRDLNAAQNILRRGIYELASKSKTSEVNTERLLAQAC